MLLGWRKVVSRLGTLDYCIGACLRDFLSAYIHDFCLSCTCHRTWDKVRRDRKTHSVVKENPWVLGVRRRKGTWLSKRYNFTDSGFELQLCTMFGQMQLRSDNIMEWGFRIVSSIFSDNTTDHDVLPGSNTTFMQQFLWMEGHSERVGDRRFTLFLYGLLMMPAFPHAYHHYSKPYVVLYILAAADQCPSGGFFIPWRLKNLTGSW